jgi:hypothetical protein
VSIASIFSTFFTYHTNRFVNGSAIISNTTLNTQIPNIVLRRSDDHIVPRNATQIKIIESTASQPAVDNTNLSD